MFSIKIILFSTANIYLSSLNVVLGIELEGKIVKNCEDEIVSPTERVHYLRSFVFVCSVMLTFFYFFFSLNVVLGIELEGKRREEEFGASQTHIAHSA